MSTNITGTQKTGVVYGRISKDRANETSSETQLSECAAFAAVHGITVTDSFFDYGRSAYKVETVKRPEFENAMRLIESGAANVLIVWKLDRLIRNARGFMRIHERLTAAGATFVSKSEPWFDTSTPIGLALVMLMAAMAEMEAEAIRMRVAPVQARKMASGDVPQGKEPFGYVRSFNSLTINEEQAALIRDAACAILNGQSIRSIAREWTEAGIPSPTGKDWTHASIRNIVTNATTAGMREDGDGRLIPGKWEPILDAATFAALRAFTGNESRNGRQAGEGTALRHYLTGQMHCGRDGCDGRLLIKSHVVGKRYNCPKCHLSIQATVVDPFIDDAIRAHITDEVWQELRAQGKRSDPAALARLATALDHERAKWLDGIIDDAQWDATQAQINARAEAIAAMDSIELPAIGSVRDAWETLSPSDRRLVLNAGVERITVQPFRKGVQATERIDILFRAQ